jgi:solute carrier family 25 iron transporter 28/37
MIPIDNVKTHCQSGRDLNIFQIVKKIYRAGGLSNFYSGSSIVIAGCAPAHAIYFSIYEHTMDLLKCNPEQDIGKYAFVGALSAMFHDLLMTPTEALKQRIQLARSDNKNIRLSEVAKRIYKNEGLVAFYRSFPVNYAMNIPFGSLIVLFN